ncbi:uncharacterized protein LOC129309164 [Prosopis cineraria]|uniref:uncharacterized protein LOC129309164 n=1 Tax=Prosopis cineraria TaxID=364024 RepID=UPI002410449B|nr:uncharacterized protein LOC129309164 [Prosopis cineraria]
MATVILRSNDCFRGRFGHEALALTASPVRSRRNPNPSPIPIPNSNPCYTRRRKRSPVAVQAIHQDRDRSRYGGRSTVAKGSATNLVMGQVKILKRGERLNSENNQTRVLAVSSDNHKMAKSDGDFDLVLGSTDRLGPDPEMVQKQIRISDLKDGIYAGSAFVASPPPSSVPVPGFLGKNGAATSDLRRLLRLDLV